MQQSEAIQTTRLQLVLAWSFAGIPLLAGVAQTLVNAMKLFHGFALSMLAVVGVAAVLAFGFGATPDIVAPLLVLGIMTALIERKLRAKK
jgi:hypothetical protein